MNPEPTPDLVATGRRRVLTIPNLLTAARLLGSPALIVFAALGWPEWCLGWFVALWLTDWLDGKLAIYLRQRSPFGARLDSYADAAFYGNTLIALGVLRWDAIRGAAAWIGAAVAGYAVSAAAGLVRFRRVPTYHTRMAKVSWLLAGAAVIAAFAGWADWPVQAAAAAVVVTNLEATAVTLVLPGPRVDVLSVWHARRIRREFNTGNPPEGVR